MAVMRRGIVGDVSGRLGGVEFALVKGRGVVKQAKVKRSRVSDRTRVAQQQQAAAVLHWNGLTDAQRLAWDTVSREHPIPDRFGTPRVRSGRELFLSIPHDFRFGVPENWQDEPATRSVAYLSSPVINVLTTTSLILDVSMAGVSTQWVASAWFARFTKSYKRQHRNWFKGGLCEFNNTTTPPDFTASMAALNVVFVSGEQVAMKVQFWHEDFWPTWWDFDVQVIP